MRRRWLTTEIVIAMHEESIAAFGGTAGLRDRAPLESALARPRNLAAYRKGATVFDLAAALCRGLLRDHPFPDGNKRAALLSARAFLFVNGWRFEPDEMDEIGLIVGAAEGSVTERRLSRWFRDHSDRRP